MDIVQETLLSQSVYDLEPSLARERTLFLEKISDAGRRLRSIKSSLAGKAANNVQGQSRILGLSTSTSAPSSAFKSGAGTKGATDISFRDLPTNQSNAKLKRYTSSSTSDRNK